MNRAPHIGLVCLIVLGIGGSAWASLPPMAIAAKASTLGLGGDLAIGLNRQLNLRVGASALNLDMDWEAGGIEYDAGFDLSAISAQVDWYPFGNNLFVSAGAIFPDFDASLKTTPTGTITIGGTDYSASNAGTLSARVTNDTDVAPYVGVGLGNALDTRRRFGILADFGVAFTKASEVTLSSTGSVSATDLAQEQEQINEDLKDWKIFPVLTMSLFWRF